MIIISQKCLICIPGAFYYLLGNLHPRFRSRIDNIQLLALAKYSTVSKYGIDRILKPAIEDICKLESVCIINYIKWIKQILIIETHFFNVAKWCCFYYQWSDNALERSHYYCVRR